MHGIFFLLCQKLTDNAPLCCHLWKCRCPQHYRCSVLDMKPRFTFKAGRILCAKAKLQKKERKKEVQCTMKHVFDLLQVVGAESWIEWGIFAKDTFQLEWRCLLFQFTHSAPAEWPRSANSISEPVLCLCGFRVSAFQPFSLRRLSLVCFPPPSQTLAAG